MMSADRTSLGDDLFEQLTLLRMNSGLFTDHFPKIDNFPAFAAQTAFKELFPVGGFDQPEIAQSAPPITQQPPPNNNNDSDSDGDGDGDGDDEDVMHVRTPGALNDDAMDMDDDQYGFPYVP